MTVTVDLDALDPLVGSLRALAERLVPRPLPVTGGVGPGPSVLPALRRAAAAWDGREDHLRADLDGVAERLTATLRDYRATDGRTAERFDRMKRRLDGMPR